MFTFKKCHNIQVLLLFRLNLSIPLVSGEDFGLMNTKIVWYSVGEKKKDHPPPPSPIASVKIRRDFPKKPQIKELVPECAIC